MSGLSVLLIEVNLTFAKFKTYYSTWKLNAPTSKIIFYLAHAFCLKG